jgi:hypothetical protein
MTRSEEEKKVHLTCTLCNEIKEQYSAIVYSQGDRVCVDCKEITQLSDNIAFDRDMNERL